MKYLRRFFESKTIEPNMEIVRKYLGDLSDIFEDAEDEIGISFSITYYKLKYDKGGWSYYDTISVNGSESKFETKLHKPLGYFTVSCYDKSSNKPLPESKNFQNCIKRAKDNFGHEVSISFYETPEDGYYSAIFFMEEPLI
jgi:hypothetical protein